MRSKYFLPFCILVCLVLVLPVAGCQSEDEVAEAYETGYKLGYDAAYQLGYDEGEEDGRKQALGECDGDRAYQQGYRDGYEDGYDQGCTEVSPPLGAEEVIDALDTETLLDIGYEDPTRVVVVEGTIVRTYYAKGSKGEPTFLNFHDPYEGYFTALIWGSDRGNFPSNPESYYLGKTVRVEGCIEIYKGDPEIVLRETSQICVVGQPEQ